MPKYLLVAALLLLAACRSRPEPAASAPPASAPGAAPAPPSTMPDTTVKVAGDTAKTP